MKKAGKIASVSLAILLTVSGCTAPNNTNSFPTGQTTSAAALEASSSDLAQAAISYQDTETTFSDSDTIANEDNSFKTKAIGIGEPKEGELAATTVIGTGAVTTNADATITVDTKIVKDKVAAAGADIKTKLDSSKATLSVKTEVSKEKLEKIKRKNNLVRSSQVVEVTNADGSTSKIVSVEFENPRSEIKRENQIINTFSADGKLIKKEHYLTVEHNSYSKVSTRVMSFNADGSKTVDTESKTTWANGKVRELVEHRVINADNSAEGTGTAAVTANGETKTYNLNVNATASGDISIKTFVQGNAANSDGPEEVTVTEKANGTTTVAVANDGSIETHTVDLDQTASVEIK